MTRLLISDLHLSKERPAITRAFFRFMEQEAVDADELYILGDLFEAWIGDDDPSALARATITALRKLSDSGTRLYFMHGNRDFLVGRRFARETGCTLLPSYHRITSGNHTVVLCHGDTLCTGDKEYQRYRRRVRTPLVRWVLSRLPLRRRLKLAADWRAKSMAANSNKPDNIMDVTPAEVEHQLAVHGATVMIHGHTHRPGVHHHDNGDRVVLGDWENFGWYVKIEGEELDLIDFPIGSEPPKSKLGKDVPADIPAPPFILQATATQQPSPRQAEEDNNSSGPQPSQPSPREHPSKEKNRDRREEIQLSLDL